MTTKTTTYSDSCIYSCLDKAGLPACLLRKLSRCLSYGGSQSKLCIMHYALCIIAILLSTLFYACGHDDLVMPDEYPEEKEPPYIELRIAVPLANPTATRANPMGGEEGNGRERGIENEDKIHDINVFFYIEDSKDLGMDSQIATIKKHIYYNLKDTTDSQNTPQVTVDKKTNTSAPDYLGQGYVYLRFECTQDEIDEIKAVGGINFVAVANTGKLQNAEGKNLEWLKNQLFTKTETPAWSTKWDAFSKDASNMDYFLMSTAYNTDSTFGSNKISTSTSGNANEYSGTTTLQRMYARLDLWYNKDDNAITTGTGVNEKVTELKYQVKEATSNYVYVTNILPVNVMQSPSFLFKKVTDGLSSFNSSDFKIWASEKYSWGGKESPKDGIFTEPNYDLPTNYVMEPHTLDKKTVDEIKEMSEAEATAHATELKEWYGNTSASVVADNSASGNGIKNSANGKLNGYYHTHRDPAGNDPTDYDCNHISIISYANENTHPTNCFHSNYLTGMAFRAVYVPEKLYSRLTESTDADGNTKVVATEWQTGDVEPTQIYRYSPTNRTQKESKSKYFTSREVAEKYAEGHPEDMAIISDAYTAEKHTIEDGSQKWGFVCYYNVWLRHYNDEAANPQTSYPMEYATVRNNIYRLAVSFIGPGDPEPTMREPDTMKARIFVRKWNYRAESEIIF